MCNRNLVLLSLNSTINLGIVSTLPAVHSATVAGSPLLPVKLYIRLGASYNQRHEIDVTLTNSSLIYSSTLPQRMSLLCFHRSLFWLQEFIDRLLLLISYAPHNFTS